MVKSYLIDGESISSNPRYRGTALKAISRFGESRYLIVHGLWSNHGICIGYHGVEVVALANTGYAGRQL